MFFDLVFACIVRRIKSYIIKVLYCFLIFLFYQPEGRLEIFNYSMKIDSYFMSPLKLFLSSSSCSKFYMGNYQKWC